MEAVMHKNPQKQIIRGMAEGPWDTEKMDSLD